MCSRSCSRGRGRSRSGSRSDGSNGRTNRRGRGRGLVSRSPPSGRREWARPGDATIGGRSAPRAARSGRRSWTRRPRPSEWPRRPC
eukprot:2211871-Pyramimonas_sp.AAC.1